MKSVVDPLYMLLFESMKIFNMAKTAQVTLFWFTVKSIKSFETSKCSL